MPMAYVLQGFPRRPDAIAPRSWGVCGEGQRPAAREPMARPCCRFRGSGDDAGDPEDPTNSREAAGATARRLGLRRTARYSVGDSRSNARCQPSPRLPISAIGGLLSVGL
jgi:hypothetical protein